MKLPFAVSDISEPEPDIAIVPWGEYRKEQPSTAHLIIEVTVESIVG